MFTLLLHCVFTGKTLAVSNNGFDTEMFGQVVSIVLLLHGWQNYTHNSLCIGSEYGARSWDQGLGVQRYMLINFSVVVNCDTITCYILQLKFISDKWQSSSAAQTPVKYERVIRSVTYVKVVMKNRGTEVSRFSTPHPRPSPAAVWLNDRSPYDQLADISECHSRMPP